MMKFHNHEHQNNLQTQQKKVDDLNDYFLTHAKRGVHRERS